jgi:hypothetical protein
MLQLEKHERGRFFGPVTWMRHRGRCDGNKRFLHCCHPADARPVGECRQVKVTKARSLALQQLAPSMADRTGALLAPRPSSAAAKGVPTLFEFHWPDSAIGAWGEPHTFLQMLPRMRPEVLPGCRVVVTTVLRDPLTHYPSLQRHQYDAMREYGREALRERCACNLTACDLIGFIRAFPNFQSWRLTSSRWLYPPLERVGHDAMLAAASRLLSRLDLVGVFERLDDWLTLVCERASIVPCGRLMPMNQRRVTQKTARCGLPDNAAVQVAVQQNALADVSLHALATSRFQSDWARHLQRSAVQV